MEPRRALLLFRLVFYPAAAVIAVLLLFGRGLAAEKGTTLRGTTSQGETITLYVNSEGHPSFFDTHLVANCPEQGPWRWRWWPGNDAPVPFEIEGDRLRVTETQADNSNPSPHVLTLDARFTEHEVGGTMRLDAMTDGGTWCHSGEVKFSTQR